MAFVKASLALAFTVIPVSHVPILHFLHDAGYFAVVNIS